ncbi:MAG: hypothetical protein KAJ07_00415 [Planctomycetes bacterium]|nr:hypothetical protein [Planctomycetota bacterium]
MADTEEAAAQERALEERHPVAKREIEVCASCLPAKGTLRSHLIGLAYAGNKVTVIVCLSCRGVDPEGGGEPE